MNIVEFKNVSYSIDGKPIIRNVSFTIPSCSSVALLGPSGVGKSTILQLLSGFQQPNSGTILIDEETVFDIKTNVLPEKRKVGILFQDLALFPHLKVRENIAFGLRKLSSSQKKDRTREIAEPLEVDTLLERYPYELSGGQQQRVALARAIAPSPRLVLLDEPFSQQDSDLRIKLAKSLRQILSKEKISSLMVTHDHDEAFLGEYIGILKDGELLQWDSPYNIYHMPTKPFVANFVSRGGLVNAQVIDRITLDSPLGKIRGTFSQDVPAGTPVKLLIRPEEVSIDNSSKIQGRVIDKSFQGGHFLFVVDFGQKNRINVICKCGDYQIDQYIGIKVDMALLTIFTDCPFTPHT